MNPSDRPSFNVNCNHPIPISDEYLNRPSRRALVTKGTNTDPTEMGSLTCSEWARLCDSTATKTQTYENYVKALNYINLCHSMINEAVKGGDSKDSSKLIMPDFANFIDIFTKLSNVSEKTEVAGSETSSKTVVNTNEEQFRSLPKSSSIRRANEEYIAALKNYKHEQIRQMTKLISMKESQEFLSLEEKLSRNNTNTRIGIREYLDSNESSCEHDFEVINTTKSCLSCSLPQNTKNRNEDNQRGPANCMCVESDDRNRRTKTQDYHNVPSPKRLEEKSEHYKSGMSGDNVYDNISEGDLNRYASELLQDNIEIIESSPGSYEELSSPKKQSTYITSSYFKKIPNCFPPLYEADMQPTNQQESFRHNLHDKPPGHATIMVPKTQRKQGVVGKNLPRGFDQKKNQTQTNRNLEIQLANSLGKCEDQPAKHKSQPNSSHYNENYMNSFQYGRITNKVTKVYATEQFITTNIPEVKQEELEDDNPCRIQFDDPTRPIDNKKSLRNMLFPIDSSMITADCNSLRAAFLNREVHSLRPSTLQVRPEEIDVPTQKNNLSKINKPSKNLDFETDFSACDTEDLLSDSDEIESEHNLLPRFNQKQPRHPRNRHPLELNNRSFAKANQTTLSQMEMFTKKGQITKFATERLKQVRNNTIIGKITPFRKTKKETRNDLAENCSMSSSDSDESISVHKSPQYVTAKNGNRGNPRDGLKNR